MVNALARCKLVVPRRDSAHDRSPRTGSEGRFHELMSIGPRSRQRQEQICAANRPRVNANMRELVLKLRNLKRTRRYRAIWFDYHDRGNGAVEHRRNVERHLFTAFGIGGML
jgi:hypothetical protein